MDQFAQLRDRVKEFRKRNAQVLIVMSEEPSHNRGWLRGRDKWAKIIPDFFEQPADKHPWLKNVGAGPEEPDALLLGDPSFTTSADYGVALQDFFADGNWPATFVIDREGVIRFAQRSKNGIDRTSVARLLKAVDELEEE
jgi:peroxiredoxin